MNKTTLHWATVLHFCDNRNTEMPISLTIKEIVNSDGNNGGGSMGLISLLLMVVLRIMRQQR
ncbi:GlyGly-CTERM sorting domain-containing protein [Vibrio metschnikovii]|uniref:GlyGly-CTERM sorting domain-containing protein n=1 Tax=Vibrio metschnikovii TaxID=28172 RepID=UPI0039F1A5D4